jgi:glycosyltransferase involved in cell wall biosynthesis
MSDVRADSAHGLSGSQRDNPRVAVNLLWCVPGHVGGSEEYLARQLLGLAEAHAPFDLDVYAPRGYAVAHPDVAERFRLALSPEAGMSRARRVALESSWLVQRTRGADLVHHGGGTVPTISRRPIVLTIHDLQYRSYPHYMSPLKLRYLSRQIPASVRRAAVIAVPSEYVRSSVSQAFGVELDDIVVVPHGLEAHLGAGATAEDELRHRFGLEGKRVLVFPAATFPHKRHGFLLELMANHWTDPDLRLVLLGGKGLAEEAVERRIVELRLERRVVRTGRVSARDRDGLIRIAEALVFPSEYEGFGAPVIEAMALGVPVVASDRASIPEVVGDAGLILPLDQDAWSGALDHIRARRAELVAGGLRRAATFTARASGEALAKAYAQACSRARS